MLSTFLHLALFQHQLLPMAEPAPYGGFMTRTLDAEKEQQEKLKQQQVDIVVNGETETLRPEALHIRGVDNLSTDDIKAFVDYYLNYHVSQTESGEVYEAKPEEITFRVQWIDDTNVNVAFKTHEDARAGLDALSITDPNTVPAQEELSQEYVSSMVQERETKPYNPSIAFHKELKARQRRALPQDERDLFEKKVEEEEQIEEMDEDENTLTLYVRQSLQSDRKVKNAAAYSRYYLLHGEPDRTRPRGRGQFKRDEREVRAESERERAEREPEREPEAEDLFADKLKNGSRRTREDDEDLFAWRMRERSPERM